MQISLQTMVLSIQIFLGMGLRLRALRARVELRLSTQSTHMPAKLMKAIRSE